jgi:hypothetical protein
MSACSSSSPGGSPGTDSGGRPGVDGNCGGTGTDGSSGGPSTDGSCGGTATEGGSGGGDGGDGGTHTDGGSVTDSGGGGTPATGPDGGAACASLTGPADKAYPRWPMPNPVAAALPNPFSYTDNGDGTVLDNVTKLTWQKDVIQATQSYTWADAPAYCSSLTLTAPAGSTWQVPTRIQLLSLVDYTTGAAMDGPFLGSDEPPGGKYTWTGTPWVVSQLVDAGKPQDAWMVNFGGGGGLTSNAASQSDAEYVRCVAAPPVTPLPYPHYVQVDTDEVRDVETGLIWVQTSNLTLLSQADAISYCAGLGLNGHTWRLPSVNELSSLVDDNPDIKRVSPRDRPVCLSRYVAEHVLHVLVYLGHHPLGSQLRGWLRLQQPDGGLRALRALSRRSSWRRRMPAQPGSRGELDRDGTTEDCPDNRSSRLRGLRPTLRWQRPTSSSWSTSPSRDGRSGR